MFYIRYLFYEELDQRSPWSLLEGKLQFINLPVILEEVNITPVQPAFSVSVYGIQVPFSFL